MTSASVGSEKCDIGVGDHGDELSLICNLLSDHASDPRAESSGDRHDVSDSGSIDLPSTLLMPTGETRGSSSANFSENISNAGAHGRLSFEITQPAPVLPIVHLTTVDRQRLATLAKLMKAETRVTTIDCCNVFMNEILQDFPAQVFLQEPEILEILITTVESIIKLEEESKLTSTALRCLWKVTEKLITQVIKYQDPSMISNSEENQDDVASHKSWSLLEFCWSGMSIACLCLRTSDLSLVLVEALSLLKFCLATHASFFPGACDSELGRLALLLTDIITSKPPTFAYMQVLHYIKQYMIHQPSILKQSQILLQVLQDAVLNPGIWCLNPDLAKELITLLKDIPKEDNFWKQISGVTELCTALSSANTLLISSGKNCNKQLLEEAVISLDFAPNMLVTKFIVESCARALDWEATSVILSLLAHSNPDVRAEAYHHCHHVVVASIGVGQAKDPITYSPENVSFLANVKVMQEILCFGLDNQNDKVKANAKDIIIHMMRSRLVISPVLWSQISSCIAFLLPLLIGKSQFSKTLCKSVLYYLSPENRGIDTFQCVRGNACLLYSISEKVRMEAARRLLWCVDQQEQSSQKWPQSSEIKIDAPCMSSLCLIQEPIVLSSNIATLFYNEASLRQIVGLLSPQGSEPSIRHSALCQLAAMLQEPRLHAAFLEVNGLELCVKLLDDALIQSNIDVLSKSVKPITTILCRILGNDTSLCHTLAQDENLLLNLIRAMFLYSSVDVDFKQHLSAVLVLLLFSDMLRHKPSQPPEERLVLPYHVVQGLHLPLKVGSYARASSNTSPDDWQRLRTLAGEKSYDLALLLRCHTTMDNHGQLVSNMDNETSQLSKEEQHILSQYDASVCVRDALDAVQGATSHTQVFAALSILRSYLPYPLPLELDDLPWKDSFSRFLSQPPATEADATLLTAVINLLADHGITNWLSHQDIVLKLDPHQTASVEMFLPLLQHTSKTMGEECTAKAIMALCKCLLSCFENSNSELLRSVLCTLGKMARDHDIQLSSRLMAELIEPLVDVVGKFDTDGSFISLGLIEEALHCLCLLQSNNMKNFTHHFCAYSENCDIFHVLGEILSSDKTIVKASSLVLLSGLATCNGMKNNTMDLAAYIQKSLSLAVDKNETCLVRQQSVVLLSSVVNNPATIPEIDVFIRLLSEYQWFKMVGELTKCVYLKETFQFLFSENVASPIEGSPENVLKQLVNPDYIATHYKFLFNLIVVAPYTITLKFKEHELFTKSVKLLSTCLEDTTNLRIDVCNLITQVSNLIAFCLITDEQQELVNELNNFPYLAPKILRLLETKEFGSMSAAIFWLIVAMEQAGHATPFILAFEHGLFWQPISRALENTETARSAMLLVRALTLQSKSARPVDTSIEVDAGCVEVCNGLLYHLQKDESHQAAMAALAGLLAGWPAARKNTLDHGLLESVAVAMRHCRTGLLLLQDMRQLMNTTQIHPYIEELIDTFELLVGFLLNDSAIKKCASETILADEVNQLWPICLVNSKLRNSTLKFLAIYTADCEKACTSLLLRQQTLSGVKVKRCATSGSLIHQLVALVSKDLNSSDTAACLVLRILQQSCLSLECRAAIVKTCLLRDIFETGGGLSRLPIEIQKSALMLSEAITRYSEGQIALARIPEALESLSVIASDRKDECELSLLATEILKNLCFCQANRVLILTSGILLASFLKILSDCGPPRVQLVAVALWSLAANHHRSKQALKVAGFHEAVSKAKLSCHCQETLSVLDSALETLTKT